MNWSTANAELRMLLSDGATDKLAHRKAVFGNINGVNAAFKTLEFRRVATLVGAVAPLGVYVNNTLVSVASDDVASGEFVLSAAPLDGVELRASYYYQWFTDAEITSFIKDGTRFATAAEDPTLVIEGLRQSALQYAAYDAYQKLAIRWTQRLSDVYRVEDSAGDKPVENPFFKLASACRKCAKELRDDYYQTQGQQYRPGFGFAFGSVRDTVPKR